jgi:hypothetical protein
MGGFLSGGLDILKIKTHSYQKGGVGELIQKN